jgi:hypothetical protein
MSLAVKESTIHFRVLSFFLISQFELQSASTTQDTDEVGASGNDSGFH